MDKVNLVLCWTASNRDPWKNTVLKDVADKVCEDIANIEWVSYKDIDGKLHMVRSSELRGVMMSKYVEPHRG